MYELVALRGSSERIDCFSLHHRQVSSDGENRAGRRLSIRHCSTCAFLVNQRDLEDVGGAAELVYRGVA
jgi:hypothetical protein